MKNVFFTAGFFAFLGAVSLWPVSALAAGFNCSKASTIEERLICSDPLLSSLDGQMDDAYAQARRRTHKKKQLLAGQRAWLVERHSCVQIYKDIQDQVSCLRSFTEERIGFLTGMPINNARTFGPSGPNMTNSLIGKRIRERCHMDVCGWLRIDRRTEVGRSAHGVLYRIDGTGWYSTHEQGSYDVPAPLEGKTSGVWYAFCSLSQPSVTYEDEGHWLVTPLSPGNPDAVFGFNESSYIDYFAACHDIEIVTDEDNEKYGRQLGYRPHELATQTSVGRIEDLLR